MGSRFRFLLWLRVLLTSTAIAGAFPLAAQVDDAVEPEVSEESLKEGVRSAEEVEREAERPLQAPTLVKRVGRDVVRGVNARFSLGGIFLFGGAGKSIVGGFSQGFVAGFDLKNWFGLRGHFFTALHGADGVLTSPAQLNDNISMRTSGVRGDFLYFFQLSPRNFVYPLAGAGIYWTDPNIEGSRFKPMGSIGGGHEFMPRLEGLSVGSELMLTYFHGLETKIGMLAELYMKYSF